MVAVRIFVLGFLAAFGYSMGQSPPHELNAFGQFVSAMFFLAAPALYLLPIYEAFRNGHRSIGSISILTVLLGWTVIGWVVALVWALNRRPAAVEVVSQPVADPAPAKVIEATKRCPYCAEEILAAAVKCKHCGSDIQAPAQA